MSWDFSYSEWPSPEYWRQDKIPRWLGRSLEGRVQAGCFFSNCAPFPFSATELLPQWEQHWNEGLQQVPDTGWGVQGSSFCKLAGAWALLIYFCLFPGSISLLCPLLPVKVLIWSLLLPSYLTPCGSFFTVSVVKVSFCHSHLFSVRVAPHVDGFLTCFWGKLNSISFFWKSSQSEIIEKLVYLSAIEKLHLNFKNYLVPWCFEWPIEIAVCSSVCDI